MPSATTKKTTKSAPVSSGSTKVGRSAKLKPVKIYPLKGTMTEEEADALIRSYGGRPMTKEEERIFRPFFKDPYP